MVYQRISGGKVISIKDGNQPYIYVGTDAGKPTPGTGDIAICTDAAKIYSCFLSGYWQVVNSDYSEEYHNHLGTVDNLLKTTTTGTATATTDAANHKMSLSSGISAIQSAKYQGSISFCPSATEIPVDAVTNIKITDIVAGTDGLRRMMIGMISNPDDAVPAGCYLAYDGTDWTWECHDGGAEHGSGAIAAIADGDLITIKTRPIIASDLHVDYLVNGVIVATFESLSSKEDYYSCAAVKATDANVTVAMSCSVDYVGWKAIK